MFDRYRRTVEETQDLDLLPVMNLFMVLIPFLLMGAAFFHIGVIPASLPSHTPEVKDASGIGVHHARTFHFTLGPNGEFHHYPTFHPIEQGFAGILGWYAINRQVFTIAFTNSQTGFQGKAFHHRLFRNRKTFTGQVHGLNF